MESKNTKNQTECRFYVYIITSFLLLITLPSLSPHSPTHSHPLLQTLTLINNLTKPPLIITTANLAFHPLKDKNTPPYTHPNKTWFMSTLTGHAINGLPEHFIFPSITNPHILCIHPHNKSYAFTRFQFVNADTASIKLLNGLTFIADSYYDYTNPWHGLNAIAPFFSWMLHKPNDNYTLDHNIRFMLFKGGDRMVKRVGKWVENLVNASLDQKGYEMFNEEEEECEKDRVVCLEKAVVMRRGLGGMSRKARNHVFGMMRLKAWKYCSKVDNDKEEEEAGLVRVSLVGRAGMKRSLRNESEVKEVMEKVCSEFNGCRFQVILFDGNVSFCDQVKAMKKTDILATTHGAQLTNMMFMPRGSSVMEMFPTGWLEGAGVGQFIYQWFADWTELRYEGAWRDPTGFNCSNLKLERPRCFAMQKDQQVGVDPLYLQDWLRRVIRHFLDGKNASDLHGRFP